MRFWRPANWRSQSKGEGAVVAKPVRELIGSLERMSTRIGFTAPSVQNCTNYVLKEGGRRSSSDVRGYIMDALCCMLVPYRRYSYTIPAIENIKLLPGIPPASTILKKKGFFSIHQEPVCKTIIKHASVHEKIHVHQDLLALA